MCNICIFGIPGEEEGRNGTEEIYDSELQKLTTHTWNHIFRNLRKQQPG